MRPRRPIPSGSGRHAVYPMVAVNRRSPSGATELPSRDRLAVVEIADIRCRHSVRSARGRNIAGRARDEWHPVIRGSCDARRGAGL